MMTAIAIHPEVLRDVVAAALGDKARSVTVALGDVTVEVSAAQDWKRAFFGSGEARLS